jgi:glycogen debranching enzyme
MLELPKTLQKLNFPHFKNTLYSAGHPRYTSNFSRDSLIAGLLFEDPDFLQNQLQFCASQQGQKSDPYTGEEYGKIHHEIPEIAIRGYTTRYAACDTTALFVLGHQKYIQLTGDKSLFEAQKGNILAAQMYIQNHIKDGYFIESPSFSGSQKFALKVTYWKDSDLVDRPNNEPVYPICYTLIQAQNLAAIKFLAKEFQNPHLVQTADRMLKVLQEDLFDPDIKDFCIAKDEMGLIFSKSSDSLHILYYLEKGDLKKEHISGILEAAKELQTKVGYRTMIETEKTVEEYHSKTVWPFEQAIIHAGGLKFDLPEITQTAILCYHELEEDDSELFIIHQNGHFTKGGNPFQLWTVAAKVYFQKFLNSVRANS